LPVHASPSPISEGALALALRLRISELDDEQHVRIGASAIPDRRAIAPDSADAWIYGAYAVVMSRTPDDQGLAGFRQSLEFGKKPTFVLQELRRTPEGRDRRAKLPADPRNVFVIGCHLLALGRSPSPAEMLEGRTALDHGQSETAYLAALSGSLEARRALRFPPPSPDRNLAVAVAIQRATCQTENVATTAHLAAGLAAGRSVTDVLNSEMRRHAHRLPTRLRVRLTLRSTVAQVESIAAGLLAQQESALNRDLVWRIQLAQWRRGSSPDDTPLGQPLSRWFG